MAKYSIGEKVKTWWRGEYVNGWIEEIVHGHCYRVRLTTGELCYRLESDVESR